MYARQLHLWTGLLFGTILVVLGLTGSALAWIEELDSLLNPQLLHAAPPAGTAPGAPLRLSPETVQSAHDVLARDPRYGAPSQLMLSAYAGDVIVAWYRVPGKDASRQVMLDPATLRVTGERVWGESGLSRPQLMPTLFHLHRYLLAGERGKLVVAVTGAALLLTTLSGLVLWWPRMTRSAIWKALTVRHGGYWPRFSFQLHRAAGFFAAPVFLVLAFSGVHFNMPSWTTPVVDMVASVTAPPKASNRSTPGQRISAAEAIRAAQARFPEARVSRIAFPAGAKAPYEIRLRQAEEIRQGSGATRVSVDAGDGALLRVIDPVRAQGGERVIGWLFPLHTGEAFGAAGRVLVCIAGLMPLMFFVTGLVVWLRLRRKKAAPSSLSALAGPRRPLVEAF